MGNKIITLIIILLLFTILGCKNNKNRKTYNTFNQNEEINYTEYLNNEILQIDKPKNFETFKFNEKIEIVFKEFINPDSIFLYVNDKRLTKFSFYPETKTLSFYLNEHIRAGKNIIEVKAYIQNKINKSLINIYVANNLPPIEYSYTIKKIYEHNVNSYTQGLVYFNNYMYESSGLYGKSCLMKYDLEKNLLLYTHKLPDTIFAEGIEIYNDKLYLLTWQSGVVFVYDVKTFNFIEQKYIQTEGWGLTSYDNYLVLSDGSNSLKFIDPENFSEIFYLEVWDNKGPIKNLNELEYIPPYIYANVYLTNEIVLINPKTGFIEGKINLSELLNQIKSQFNKEPDVLNGIAYDKLKNRIFVTGKFWPKIFQIEIHSINKTS